MKPLAHFSFKQISLAQGAGGKAVADHPGMVVMNTIFGSGRVVDMLVGEQFPRIC